MKGIIGRKVGMTQMFATNGELIPVTLVEIKSNVVTQIKTIETDGYEAIQVGVEDKREKLSNKPEQGHVAKANTAPKRMYQEIKFADCSTFELGAEIKADIFEAGEMVDVQGTTKGKGFQGVIKRHGQACGPMAHGSRYHRRPGSMGAVAPQVFKGKKLPGQMGAVNKTVQNLEVIKVDLNDNVIVIKGNIPGAKNSFVTIKSAIKKPGVKKTEKDLVTYAAKENKESAE